MFKLGIVLIGLMTCLLSEAAPVRRLYQDVKLPSQQMVEKQTIASPAVNNTAVILKSIAGPTSAAALTVTSFAAQPDVPRNVLITPDGTTNDVNGCTVVVNGTSYFDKSISENFVISNHQSSSTTGNKAFKTLTSLVFPINCESGGFAATWSMGWGTKLGLKRCMANPVDFLAAGLAGVRESTFATVAADNAHVESNTIILNSTLNSTDVQAYFIQNFGCFP